MENEKIDIATCSKCKRQDIFETPKQLTALIGTFPEDTWTTVIPFPYQLDNVRSTCPDCSSSVIGYRYILTEVNQQGMVRG